jgi:hypothetical protein
VTNAQKASDFLKKYARNVLGVFFDEKNRLMRSRKYAIIAGNLLVHRPMKTSHTWASQMTIIAEKKTPYDVI